MQFKPYLEKVALFQKNFIPRNSLVLDLGCGPGNNAKILLERDDSCKITGIDLSVEMINMARKNVPGGNFIVQDLREIKPDKNYDAIIASFCIVHLSDDETENLVSKIARMLKAKGSLYLSFMAGKKPGRETTSFSEDEIFFNYFERNAIVKLLLKNSMEIMQVSSEGYRETDRSITEDVFIFARKRRTPI